MWHVLIGLFLWVAVPVGLSGYSIFAAIAAGGGALLAAVVIGSIWGRALNR